ncbi:hypothetical protein F5Y06DRAFT_298957 [Hypoxylon sp. FL0890]|nr:hypothetical protein F5Y06DRAFT_298957 [Hypoxylon sp. FL0890]
MSSTLLPFLYHTRTILRANPRTTAAFARTLHATSRRLKRKDDIPFVLEVGDEVVDEVGEEEKQGDEDKQSQPTARGTITPSERRIFERIFADIRARGLKPAIKDDSQSAAATRSTMLIMNQAAQDAGQARRATIAAPGLLAGAARDRNKALLRFPPELRAAASKALGAIETSAQALPNGDDIAYDEATIAAGQGDDEGWTTPPHLISRTVELEAKRYPERSRVEGLIAAAKTDFELWDVLEKEVFTMPSKLGLGRITYEPEETKPAEAQGKKKGRKKKEMNETSLDETANSSEDDNATLQDATPQDATLQDATLQDAALQDAALQDAALQDAALQDAALQDAEVAENIEGIEDIADESNTPPRELSLYIHGPLYPAYLLLALRRLDTAFRVPSPLAFSVLPRIKELGLESYVLGVSTPFYNELMRIYWTRRGDLSGMLDLLEEMRHCGIYFDNQTASILNHVDTAVATMAHRTIAGSFGRAIMTLPEYERALRSRIRYWHRVVDLSIQEREQDLGC